MVGRGTNHSLPVVALTALTLGELGGLAGALEDGLLAFLHAGVAGEEVLAALEGGLDGGVAGDKGAGDAHLDGAGPAADTATLALDGRAELALTARASERGEDLGAMDVAA